MDERAKALARFGRNLRLARLGAELTQAELARRVGIGQPWLSRLEAGAHECRFLTAMALARAVGVDLGALIHGEVGEPGLDRGGPGGPGD